MCACSSKVTQVTSETLRWRLRFQSLVSASLCGEWQLEGCLMYVRAEAAHSTSCNAQCSPPPGSRCSSRLGLCSSQRRFVRHRKTMVTCDSFSSYSPHKLHKTQPARVAGSWGRSPGDVTVATCSLGTAPGSRGVGSGHPRGFWKASRRRWDRWWQGALAVGVSLQKTCAWLH